MRLTRAQLLEVLRQDYVRTAWAKGVRERAVVLKHSLKNALIPVITVLGTQIAQILGGVVIFETIFGLPGMGRFLFDAINQRDYPVIQGVNLVIVTVVVVMNLVVDACYSYLTRASGTDAMANHVETLTSPSTRTEVARAETAGVPVLGAVWRFCRRKPLGAVGGLIVLVLIVMAVFAPWIAHYAYDETLRGVRMKAPGAQFWMGTDNLGRDIWSRVVYGARISVTVGFCAVLILNVLAAGIGITSGYLGGKYESVRATGGRRLAVLSLHRGDPFHHGRAGTGAPEHHPGPWLFGAANASRVVRGATVSVAQNVYVEAARALGAGHLRIMVQHILPNVAATIIVLSTIGLGAIILAESALSFLGFGVPPPYPSWGGMLSGSGRSFFSQAPWMAIYPGLAISLAVFGFNMLGDALRDVLDPRLRGAGGRMR